jgi:DNA-binding transcriptional regulator YdaS (Cro superfamily)
MTGRATPPRRELVTLLVYLDAGSHKAAAHRLGISESTARQRVSLLIRRVGARNVAQAVWRLRQELETEVHEGRYDRLRSVGSLEEVRAGLSAIGRLPPRGNPNKPGG